VIIIIALEAERSTTHALDSCYGIIVTFYAVIAVDTRTTPIGTVSVGEELADDLQIPIVYFGRFL
jgi:hypothetical protein